MVLRNVKVVFIETDDNFEKHSVDLGRYLSEADLMLKEKCQSEMFKNGPYKNIYNLIWYRLLAQRHERL